MGNVQTVSAAEVIREALVQYADLPDHEAAATNGPEDYVLRRLNEAGYAVVEHSERLPDAETLADILSHHSGLTRWQEKAEAVLSDIRDGRVIIDRGDYVAGYSDGYADCRDTGTRRPLTGLGGEYVNGYVEGWNDRLEDEASSDGGVS